MMINSSGNDFEFWSNLIKTTLTSASIVFAAFIAFLRSEFMPRKIFYAELENIKKVLNTKTLELHELQIKQNYIAETMKKIEGKLDNLLYKIDHSANKFKRK